MRTGKLHSPTITHHGYNPPANRKKSLNYQNCPPRDAEDKKRMSGMIISFCIILYSCIIALINIIYLISGNGAVIKGKSVFVYFIGIIFLMKCFY